MRNATRDSGQGLNSYQKFTALNETANKIPLWDMWQNINLTSNFKRTSLEFISVPDK